MNAAQHTPGPLFQVQQKRYGALVCNVGSPCSEDEAQAIIDAQYRADWEATGRTTPVTEYTMVCAEPQAPGPWFVEPCTEGPSCGMWSVARWNPAAEPGYAYESMLDANGGEALFNSPAEARAAIAKATGSAA